MKRILKRKTKELIFYCLIIALPMLHFCIFYIGVNINSIFLAFKEYDLQDKSYFWVGFENFSRLFQRFRDLTVFSVAFKNSLIIYFWGTSIGLICSLLFSYYIYKKAPFKNGFKILLFLPSIIPSIAMITMFRQFVESGIPGIMRIIFHTEVRGLISNPDTTLATIIFYNIWIGFGVGILLYVGAMNNISESVVEAAKLDGVGFIKEFLYITLPMIYPTIVTVFIAGLGGIFINQANLYSFFNYGAEERVYTIGYYLFKETVGSTDAGYPILSAFGILLTLVTVPLVYLMKWICFKFGPKVE